MQKSLSIIDLRFYSDDIVTLNRLGENGQDKKSPNTIYTRICR